MENKKSKVIGIYNQENEWIGNIAINLENLEVENYLKDGYTIETKDEQEEKNGITKKDFLESFEIAKNKKSGIIVFVDIPGNKHYESIANNFEDLDSKKEYYDRTYDENMNHIYAPEIKIVGVMPFDVIPNPKVAK